MIHIRPIPYLPVDIGEMIPNPLLVLTQRAILVSILSGNLNLIVSV